VSAPVRVLLADDQALVRAGFRLILGAEPGVEVVGEAEDGQQAVDLARVRRPDVVLMDIQMPGRDGLDATREILSTTGGPVRVVILTTFDRDEYVFDALQAGASGFLLKNAPPEHLIEAVRVVAAGDALLAPSVTRRVIAELAGRRVGPRKELARALGQLTERETEVLLLVASGRSNAEIAAVLVLGEATVKSHVSSILLKLGLRDRVQAVIAAYEGGLVSPGDAVSQGRAVAGPPPPAPPP
jgi:DNA-binding NarL/FixJ family response regulator